MRMSPELTFLLTLALRMAITAAFVVTSSIITEKSGPGHRRAGGDLADFGGTVLRLPRARP